MNIILIIKLIVNKTNFIWNQLYKFKDKEDSFERRIKAGQKFISMDYLNHWYSFVSRNLKKI